MHASPLALPAPFLPADSLRAQLMLAAGFLGAPRRWRGARPTARDSGWTLWQRACEGDPGSAASLVQHLTPAALAMARHMLGRREDAEDAVQESFLRLWNARPQDAHGAQLSTYFNTIVLNRCRTQLVRRRELGMDPADLSALQDTQQSQTEAFADDSVWTRVSPPQWMQALAALPARQRMALAMWAYADASAAEIGQALEIDTNGAHQLLHRAKARLRQALQGEST
ncbi:RNA polymerase sigma factor [Hydrogenophaga sp. BPS33]|uniref:RNA polymerase sigma factor n=1 Tax=Hydrogenophaga sp. BPS33 TaxID=2651974 RepID=UPI0013203F5F|nr:sigma-70 family RNA polymerase sigma factor [Hydrogenophaga sp. BPS33]QHE88426.1 sigma-70 family RNA polymerase sigma factor [Hydrogenophaga sp. BPS33]